MNWTPNAKAAQKWVGGLRCLARLLLGCECDFCLLVNVRIVGLSRHARTVLLLVPLAELPVLHNKLPETRIHVHKVAVVTPSEPNISLTVGYLVNHRVHNRLF